MMMMMMMVKMMVMMMMMIKVLTVNLGFCSFTSTNPESEWSVSSLSPKYFTVVGVLQLPVYRR